MSIILLGRWVKIWASISLLSMLLWVVYWLRPSYEHFFNVVQGWPDSYVSNLGLVYWSGHAGLNARFVAAVLGLFIIALLSRQTNFGKLMNLSAAALLSEASYFALEVPFVWNLLSRSVSVTFLAYSYLVQALFTVPAMAVLAFKVKNYDERRLRSSVWKWVGIAFLGYIVALWANVVMRWFDMVSLEGLGFLVSGLDAVGFVNATIFMSLAVGFAILGAVSPAKQKKGHGMKWIGLALTMVGLHYVVYAFYSYFVDALSYTWLVDIWTIPFLGLGLALLKTQKLIGKASP